MEKDTIIQALQDTYTFYGRKFTEEEFNAYNKIYNSFGVRKHFGTWHKALLTVLPKKEKPIKQKRVPITKAEFDQLLKNVYTKLGRKFTLKEFTNETGIKEFRRFYTTWKEALVSSGIDLPAKQPKEKRQTITKEMVIKTIQEFDGQPEIEDLPYSQYKISKLFGSWNQALSEAGKPKKGPITKEEAILILRETSTRLGGMPARKVLISEGGIPDSSIDRLFNNYTTMLKEAGLENSPTIYGFRTENERQRRRRNKAKKKEKKRQEFIAKTGRAKPIGSYTQEKLVAILTEILGDPLHEHTFDWFTSSKTGYNYRVDAYFPEYNLAFEYQSEIHFQDCSWIKKTSFKDRIWKDYEKRQLLQTNKVKLLEIAYFEPHTKEYIINKLNSII